MLSRWTKKDASQNGSGSGASGERHQPGGLSPNGAVSPVSPSASMGGLSLHDKEKVGPDGLTPIDRAILEGMERFYGMENFGNTCYANSVVQALFFCRPFRDCVNTYPSLLSPYSPTDTPLSDLSSSKASSPAQSPGATRSRGWPGSKRVPSGHGRADSGDSSMTLELPRSKRDRSRSRSPSRGPTSLQQPTYPPPASLFEALQSLFRHISSIPPPASYVVSSNKDKDGNPPTPVPSVSKVIAPAAFIAKLKVENVMFQGTMQQDAHEFLNFLLNKIGEDLAAEDRERRSAAKAKAAAARALATEDMEGSTGSVSTAGAHSEGLGKPEPTFVQKLFEGTLVNETRCLTCETTSSRDESFLDLSIDIEQNTSVTACLRQFSASETLCQKNKFYCDTCCGLQEAEKRMKIKTLPNVLALHLKRFKYQEDLGRYVKLSYRVVFPFHLRLPNTSDETDNPDRLYELFAFVVHVGGGPHQGHYVAIVKTSAGWMMFDDTNVSPVDPADIQRYFGESNSGSGYVLFYQAADLDPASLGLRKRPGAPSPTPAPPPTASRRSDKPSPPESLDLPQPALSATAPHRSIPTLHLPPAAPPVLAAEVSTPSAPVDLPTPPSEADDDPAGGVHSPSPTAPRERFASAPAFMPSSPVRRRSDLPQGSPPRMSSHSRTASHSRQPSSGGLDGPSSSSHARRPSTSGAEAPSHTRRPSQSAGGEGQVRRSSHGATTEAAVRRPSHYGAAAAPTDRARPAAAGPPDPEPKARRRFSSMAAASPANPAAPPSMNSAYLQSLVSGKPKTETKEEEKARKQLEKERERAQKEREKVGREREKEREKADKEREKLRREEEKAEASRVAKLEKEMERRQRVQRKASLPPPTASSAPPEPAAKSGGALSKLAGLGRSPSIALFGGKKKD